MPGKCGCGGFCGFLFGFFPVLEFFLVCGFFMCFGVFFKGRRESGDENYAVY